MDLVKESHEALRDRIWRAMQADLGEEAFAYDIVHVFEGSAIVRDFNTGTFLKMTYEDDGDEVRFGDVDQVEQAFVVTTLAAAKGQTEDEVVKSLQHFSSARLLAPIVSKADEQRIAYGPVLVPDEPDSDGDVVTAGKIEEVAHKFLRDYGNIDLQHTLNVVARPVESYIAPVDLSFGSVVVPKGSWIMGVFIEDDDTWAAVKEGRIGGFSIMGVRKSDAGDVTAMKAEDGHRVTLADLGDDWVIPFVSMVDAPAVPKAKFVMVKSQSKPGLLDRLKSIVGGSSDKAGRRFSQETYDTLKTAAEALSLLIAEADKERTSKDTSEKQVRREDDVDETQVKEIVESAVAPIAEALKGITDRLAASDEAAEKAAEETAAKAAEEAAAVVPATEEVTEDIEALKSEIEALKSTNEELTEQVEKAKSPETRSTKGQDGNEPEPVLKEDAYGKRDGYGRRIRD